MSCEPFKKSKLAGLQVTYSKFEKEGSLNEKFAPGPFLLEISDIFLY